MRLFLALLLVALLSGCVHNLRECPEPDYARFSRDMDQILELRKAGAIDEDIAMHLYALQAQMLRVDQIIRKEACR